MIIVLALQECSRIKHGLYKFLLSMYITLVLPTGNREYSSGMSEESTIDGANWIIIVHFSVGCSISIKNLEFLRQFGKLAANA